MARHLFRLEALAPQDVADLALGVLALDVPYGWEEDPLPDNSVRFVVHGESPAQVERLRQTLEARSQQIRCTVTALEAQDWLAAWRAFFTPVPCGSRFVVLPPWLAATTDFPGRVKILIEPKSAFGTGHHATTALCLTALSDLLDADRVRAGQSFLDLGTGSGILGIACCKSGLVGAGRDTDPLAVANAMENRKLNAIRGFEVAVGSLEDVKGRIFDLVLANILARPLVDMAPALSAALAPGACLVLSGILKTQAEEVAEAYMAQGLPAPARMLDGEWASLVWR